MLFGRKEESRSRARRVVGVGRPNRASDLLSDICIDFRNQFQYSYEKERSKFTRRETI